MPPKKILRSDGLPDGLRGIIDSAVNPETTHQLGRTAAELAGLNASIAQRQREKRAAENLISELKDQAEQERLAAIGAVYDFIHNPENEWTEEDLTIAVNELFPDFEILEGRDKSYLRRGKPVVVETKEGFRGGKVKSVDLVLTKVESDDPEHPGIIEPQNRLVVNSGDDGELEELFSVPITPATIGSTVLKSKANISEKLYSLSRRAEFKKGIEPDLKYFGLVGVAQQTFDDWVTPVQEYAYVKDNFYTKVVGIVNEDGDPVPTIDVFSDHEQGVAAMKVLINHMYPRYEELLYSVAKIVASPDIEPGSHDNTAAMHWIKTKVRLDNPGLTGSDLAIAIARTRLDYSQAIAETRISSAR